MKENADLSRCLLMGVSALLLFTFLPIGSLAETLEERRRFSLQQDAKTIARSRDPIERRDAAKHLSYLPFTESIPPLLEALADGDIRVRKAAANSLWTLSDQAKQVDAAEVALRQALQDAEPSIQIRASWALETMGIPVADLIPTWQAVLQNSANDYERFWAAYGLIGTEPPLSLVQPVLTYAQKDADSKMGKRALKKLVATQDRSLLEPMCEALAAFHPGNGVILQALKTFQPEPDRWIELVLSQTQFGQDRLTLNALGILRNRPRKEEEIAIWLPVVAPFIEEDNTGVCSMSMALLGMAGGHAKDSIPILLDLMVSDPDRNIRRDAARAIGEIGDRSSAFSSELKQSIAQEAKPVLFRHIEVERDRMARVEAIRCLKDLQIEPAEIQPLLVNVAIHGDDGNVQSAALAALGMSGTAPAELIAQLAAFQKTAPSILARQTGRVLKSMSGGRTASPTLTATPENKASQAQAMTALRSMNADFDEMAFFRALSRANAAKIRSYLDAGVSPNYQFTSMNKQSALYALVNSMRACNAKTRPTPQETKDLVRLFLEKGADPNITDNRGNTPLMGAASKCDSELIQILLDAGADPHAKSKLGLTAMESSFMYANDGIDALIAAGARLPADKVDTYKLTYGSNPVVLDMIQRASEPK